MGNQTWTRRGPGVERVITEQKGRLEASPKDTRCQEAVKTILIDRKGMSKSLSKQDQHGDKQ